jgi:hypothetical protein
MARPTKRTPKRREAILKALQVGHGYEYAARVAGIGGTTLHDWRRQDPAFAEACKAAADYAADVAQHVLYARGLKGSDLALICWLRAHVPELYNRKMMVALGGDADNPIAIDHQHTLNKPRLLILPSNDRPAMSEAEIRTEREKVARESMLNGMPPGETDGDDAAVPQEPDGWQELRIKQPAK